MTRGIVYYNRGVKCVARLLVSLFSLRKHYSGPVTIATEDQMPEWASEIAAKLNASIARLPKEATHYLVARASLWRHVPYDVTLHLDADTLVLAPVDELLDLTEKHGFVATHFCGWGTSSGRMKRRISQWLGTHKELAEKAMTYGKAVNGGVQGWKKGSPVLVEYERLTTEGHSIKAVQKKTLDELALQLVIPNHAHFTAGPEWNCGCIHGDLSKAKILHFHGNKHLRPNNKACDTWKKTFSEMALEFSFQFKAMAKGSGDGQLDEWLSSPKQRRYDITVVTAVNPEYADRLKTNIESWMNLPGLKEQRFIVFVNGFKSAKDRAWLNKYKNVKVVRWEYPHKDATTRERMLAAFVHGPARHVKTEYWMKLDADASPTSDKWEWPDFRKATITSHRWGFSKMKGETDKSKGHWFNRLDAFFKTSPPFFGKTFDPELHHKVVHSEHGLPGRFNSFCHIEKTSFTARVSSEIMKSGGRLPVPSQDTISWYCACAWGEPVARLNMKHFFRQ